MKKFLLFIALLFEISASCTAQIDLCLPVATAKGAAVTAVVNDWECIGINPSNLGWADNHKFSFTILNVGLSVQSSALSYSMLRNLLLHPSDTFSTAQKHQFGQILSNPNGLNLYGDVNWAAFSFKIPKIGGFAMNLRDRVIAHVTLSPTAADILFNGLNSQAYQDSTKTLASKISNELAGTNFSLYQYRELNLDWGRELFRIGGGGGSVSSFDVESNQKTATETSDLDPDFNTLRVYGGLGLKYLWGLANVYGDITPGGLYARSSVTNSYGINYGNIPNFTPTNAGNLFNNVGTGTAMDIGLSAAYKNWKFGVAATDLGAIYWKHNTLTAIDTNMPRLAANNYGINSILGSNFGIANGTFLNFAPGPDYWLALPSKLRTGVSYTLSKIITLSADSDFPLNNVIGNIQYPFYATAAQFNICKSFSVSAGFCGNQTYGFNMPIGICIGISDKVQFYITTSDVLTYLGKQNNPNISAAFGLLRINF